MGVEQGFNHHWENTLYLLSSIVLFLTDHPFLPRINCMACLSFRLVYAPGSRIGCSCLGLLQNWTQAPYLQSGVLLQQAYNMTGAPGSRTGCSCSGLLYNTSQLLCILSNCFLFYSRPITWAFFARTFVWADPLAFTYVPVPDCSFFYFLGYVMRLLQDRVGVVLFKF